MKRLPLQLSANADKVYLDRRIREKVLAVMASRTSKPDAKDRGGPRMDLADFAARLVMRRAQIDVGEIPRNAGTRRTASKRALLKAIEAAGGKWRE